MQVSVSDHRFATIEDAKSFALAGNAIITLQSLKSGAHFTYKIQLPHDHEPKPDFYVTSQSHKPKWFVKVLRGSPDEGEWQYLGMIAGGEFRATKASNGREQSPSFKAFSFFFKSTTLHPELVVRHEGKCGRCGRTLTVPESIDRGIGPECASKMEGGAL